MTYFNEIDPFAAAWLRQLMADGHLEPGTVDERSIADVEADDVRGHRRQHYFAGIGGWELALNLAGWPRDREVFTGSCPCQDFSSAGKRKGIGADRDLWPTFFRLIRECRPQCVFGEQVSSAIRFGWLDRLQADMEAEGYTVGACVLGAHSAGSDHQRQRLYWVAHRGGERRNAGTGHPAQDELEAAERSQRIDLVTDGGATRGVADAGRDGLRAGGLGTVASSAGGVQGADGQRERVRADAGAIGGAERGGVGDAGGDELGRLAGSPLGAQAEGAGGGQVDGAGGVVPRPASGAVWDHWRDAVPILCRDGKRRRVPAEPGLFPLASRVSGRVAVLRTGECAATPVPRQEGAESQAEEARIVSARAALHGAGNAICVQTAALFVRAFLEAEAEGGGE